MPGWPRALVIAMMLWWGFFGSVSLSWALGSPWLVDTILQGNGLRLAFGWVSGVLLMAYGVVGSAPGIIKLLAGESLSRYGWWRIFLWMPHFWVGGILVLAATVGYQRWSKVNADKV